MVRQLLPVLWSAAAIMAAGASIWQIFLTAAIEPVPPLADAGASAPASRQAIAKALRHAAAADALPFPDLANGMFLAREAAKLPLGSFRKTLLDSAIIELQKAGAGRPLSGEAWTMVAYASALRDGGEAPLTLSSFALSYRLSPYLNGAAPWRIDFGFGHWNALAPGTRQALLREAVWLSRRGAYEHHAVFERARSYGPQAYRGFMDLWIQSRVGDADFGPLESQAPQ